LVVATFINLAYSFRVFKHRFQSYMSISKRIVGLNKTNPYSQSCTIKR